MRVLHLLQSSCFSGAENVVCQIIGMMKDEPHMEMAYCSPDGQIREALKERGIPFVPMEKLSGKEVRRAIERFQPDIIHAHDRSACVMAALVAKKIPIIAHIHVNNHKGMSSLVKNVILTLCATRFRHMFWVSDSAYEQFQFRRIVRNKSSVLYNVIDINALWEKAESDKADYNYDVVYVGRLSYQKDPERLMKVLHSVSERKQDARIAIVGNGDYAQYVAEYIENNKLADNIHYLGYFNNPLKLIRSSKALIMTSRFEGTPMVALEAQCLGVPVVSTPVDGIKKVIDDGYNGYLSDDDDEIVGRLVEILSHPDTHERLRDNSLKQAKAYNDMTKYRAAIQEAYFGK